MAIFGTKRGAVENAKQEAEAEHVKVQAAAERGASEQRRVDEARTATAEIDARVKATDPDDSNFARLVADRATAEARVEALEVRSASARDTHAAAEKKAAEADLRAWELEFAELKAGALAEDEATYKTAFGARARMRKHVAILNDLVDRANDLDAKIRQARGQAAIPVYQPRNQFGSGWASLAPAQDNFLQVAAGIVHTREWEESAVAREREAAEVKAAIAAK